MFNINISNNTLYGIIAIATLFLIIAIIFFVAFIYHTKRKFDSINEYNKLVLDKLNSYKENQGQYKNNLEESGIKIKKEKGIISKMNKIINMIRGSE